MKLTKKEEKDIWQVYNTWLHSYLNGDVETYDSFLDDEYHFIGSTNNEEFLNRKDTTAFFKATGEQFAGMTDLRKETKTLEIFGEHVFITHFLDAWFKNQEDWSFYGRFRFSSVMHKNKEGWRFIYQHFSMPDSKSEEGQTIGFDKVHLENQELREAIQRRTIELEQKNRELEIESSLERVRAIAMGMQKSEDLMSICKIVFDELQTLGFTELRNTLIHVFVDEESYFTNYDYSFATGGNINKIPFRGNPTMEKFIKVIRKSDDAFSQLTIKGKELKDWKAFRKTNKEYEDKRLDDAKSLHYYNYSVGSSGIGISTYSQISKEKQDLLQRFRNVFQLSYKRYKDISHAEAQAKETRIDLALERVRSQALAMKQSSDLLDIVVTMRNEFTNLGYEAHYFWQMMWLPETYEKAMTSGDGTKIGFVMKLPRHIHGAIPQLAKWEKSKKLTVVYAMNVDEALDYVHKMVTLGDFQNIDPQAPTEDDIRHIGGLTFIMARTTHGEIGYSLPGFVKNPPKEDIDILVKFAGAFDLAHRRFLDLQKAEKQARETQIELSLERIRSRVTAMQESSDLFEIVVAMRNEFLSLGHEADYFWHMKWTKDNYEMSMTAEDGGRLGMVITVPKFVHDNIPTLTKWEKSKEPTFVLALNAEEAWDYIENMNTHGHYQLADPNAPTQEDIQHIGGLTFIIARTTHGEIGFSLAGKVTNPPKASIDILVRFAQVFDLAYRRFEDLQKAEFQARETQIELALEKVRSRSMAMQHSNELHQVIESVSHRLIELDIEFDACSIITLSKSTNELICWFASSDENKYIKPFHLPNLDMHIIQDSWNGFNSKREIFSKTYPYKEKNEFFKYLFKHTDFKLIPKDRQQLMLKNKVYNVSNTFMGYSGIQLNRYSEKQFSKQENEILVRFGKVFEQSYIRFLDLQKAEAQTREAQIEAALERTRTQSMLMQHSDELNTTTQVFHEQLQLLGIDSEFSYLWLPDEDEKNHLFWATWSEINERKTIYKNKTVTFPLDKKEPSIEACYVAWESGVTVHVNPVQPNQVEDYFNTWSELLNDVDKFKPELFQDGLYYIDAYMDYGCFGIMIKRELEDEEKNILSRFSKEFQRTYTRFLDLQKAEAQARESEIELALERVRARTMAMQKSEELADVATILFQQVKELGIPQWTCGFNIWEIGDTEFTFYPGGPDGEILPSSKVPLLEHPIFRQFDESKRRGDELLVYKKEGKLQKDHYKYMHSLPGIGDMLQGMLDSGLEFPDYQIDHVANFKYGNMIFITYESFPEMHEVFKRFAKVFEQTYTRFLDLQKAEAQAKEAQIETALEKVRSRTMAMQKGEELQDVVVMLYKELIALGVTNFATCGYVEINEKTKKQATWVTSPGGDSLGLFHLPLTGDVHFDARYDAWKKQQTVFHQTVAGKKRRKHLEYAITTFNSKEAEEMVLNQFPDPTVFYCFNFSHGYLHLVCGSELNKEEESLLARFSKIFEQTYARFLDLQKAEKQAREAEIELALERVRARSMAMQNSEELKEVIKIVYQQLTHLKINLDHSGFVVDYTPKGDWNFWIADKQVIPSKISHPYFESVWGNQFNKAKEKGEDFFATQLSLEEKNKFYKELFTFVPELPKASKDFYLNAPSLTASTVLLDNVGLYIENFKGITYTKEENNILMRFGKVFQQSYTRFLDLQKAEAQAREAQIEASLERVRSQAMAMQTSDDLVNSTSILFEELEKLKLNIQRSGIGIFNPITKDCNLWTTVVTKKGKKELVTGITSLTIHPMLIGTFDAWKKQEPYPYILKGKELEDYYRLVEKSDFHLSKKAIGKSTSLPKEYYLYTPFGAGGLYLFSDVEPSESDKQIIKRFAEVFHLTYTRYEDLQKAEARAREAQIELALERIRSRSMAMHNSDELREAGALLFNEITKLGIESITSGYVILEEDEKIGWNYMPDPSTGQIIPIAIGVFHDKTDNMRSVIKNWKKQEPVFIIDMDEQQTIDHQTFIAEQSINFPISAKKLIAVSPAQLKLHAFNFKQGYLLNIGGELLTDDQIEIMLRFTKVFQQTYTRFLDLQKAEAQAREAKIEMALEKVRSRTMAMQHSDELPEAANVLFMEVQGLGIPAWSAGYNILSDDKKSAKCIMSSEGEIQAPFTLPLTEHSSLLPWYKAIKRKDAFFEYEQGGKDLIEHYKYMATLPELKQLFRQYDDAGISLPTHQINHLVKFTNGFLLFITYENVPEAHDIFKRFGKVFEQTYTRFLDLQNAEAQTRTAQINLAVERVRAKALAMHKSEEIMEVVAKLKDEVMGLDIPDVVAATIFLKEGDDKVRMWDLSSLEKDNDGYEIPFDITFKLKKRDPHLYVKRVWENPGNYFVEIQVEKDFKRIISFLRENNKVQIANEVEEFTEATKLKKLFHAVKKLNNGKLVIDLLNEPSTEMETILTKMGAAFDLAYKRFEDLQKAEAQAREALIEAALEKVRSRSLAMHKPDELQEVVAVVAEKLQELGVIFDAGGVILCTYFPDNKDVVHWIAVDDFSTSGRYFVPYFDNPIFNDAWDSKIRGDAYYSKEFPVAVKNHFFEHAFEHSDYKHMPKDYKEFVLQADKHHLSAAWSKNSAIIIPSLTGAIPSESEADILKRFAKVFEQAYIRFMDLQKAEAQARESKIEAALERVRSRSMAMHKSEELGEVAAILFEQVSLLTNTPNRFNIGIINEPEKTFDVWITDQEGKTINKLFVAEVKKSPIIRNVFEAWKTDDKRNIQIIKGTQLINWIAYMSGEVGMPFDKKNISKTRYVNSIFFKHGFMGTTTYIPIEEDTLMLLERFTAVFQQTYTRFLDLQKAEAQAREAQVEASLERVRSRTLAMQNSEELAQTSVVVFQQLLELGIAPNRLFIGIVKDEGASIEAWATNEDGSKLGSHFTLQASKNKSIKKMLTGWKQKKKSLVIDLKGKELQDYFQYLNEEMDIPFIHGLEQKRRVQTIAYFSGGLIGMAAPEEQPEETIKLLERFAAVFNLTYTRFNDLKVSEAQTKKAEEDLINLQAAKKSAEEALSELQLTQTQLIQSEKMASLGELTAGIAHEIQNPLNFVNNFSEVSQELIDELKEELENGDMEEVHVILNDVIQNLEKINHHGKRADGIVKGMLQHSRSSSDTKEPTNINALADEYLRLAYHGLRAKDKSFNATLVTDFDDSIGNINILPQDIGRVVLNLLTNAFYAVNEKKKQNIEGYQPTVTLTTKKNANNVIISVKDNGNGIPKQALEKIFQPFFTTKPTGQGTGLGLSMSYDIVTKGHGGKLNVDTEQGKGTEFIIKLQI